MVGLGRAANLFTLHLDGLLLFLNKFQLGSQLAFQRTDFSVSLHDKHSGRVSLGSEEESVALLGGWKDGRKREYAT